MAAHLHARAARVQTQRSRAAARECQEARAGVGGAGLPNGTGTTRLTGRAEALASCRMIETPRRQLVSRRSSTGRPQWPSSMAWGEQEPDVAGLGLLLQQVETETGARDRLGILAADQGVTWPAPGEAPFCRSRMLSREGEMATSDRRSGRGGATAVDTKVAGRPRSRRIIRGGPGVAAHTLRMLKAVFAYAVRHDLIRDNPAQFRSAAQLEDVHLHDLRHTVGAAAASAGTSLVIVGRMLGHRKARSTERYAHVTPDAAADTADEITERIAQSVAGAPVGIGVRRG